MLLVARAKAARRRDQLRAQGRAVGDLDRQIAEMDVVIAETRVGGGAGAAAEGEEAGGRKRMSIEAAKRAICQDRQLAEWRHDRPGGLPGSGRPRIAADWPTVNVGTATFRDNTLRVDGRRLGAPSLSPPSSVEGRAGLDAGLDYGDALPEEPVVLTHCCDDWPAFARPGDTWSVRDLAERLIPGDDTRVSLDGGPSFARQSICRGKVTMREYARYCGVEVEAADDEKAVGGAGRTYTAKDDAAPLYVFDPDVLELLHHEYAVPACFRHDVMACLTGTRFRPLPPAWLLVGAVASGTPIHDHPMTVAWNALLAGCKLWCCLPPDVDRSFLLLNLEHAGDDGQPFDRSALEWFCEVGDNGSNLPETARIIMQRPGEVVFLPAGWFHVVLNVETSTAISVSLSLRKDMRRLFPRLLKEDVDFAAFWVERLSEEAEESAESAEGEEGERRRSRRKRTIGQSVGMSLDDMSVLKGMLDAHIVSREATAAETAAEFQVSAGTAGKERML